MLPLLRNGYRFARIALIASRIASINSEAPLNSLLFRGSLTFALGVAGIVAFPLNRWLTARGRGHAIAHRLHWTCRRGVAARRRCRSCGRSP